MGLSLGKSSLADHDFDGDLSGSDIVAEINITPLTDVFLVLLIIFMVTSSVLSQMGIQVQLPGSSQSSQSNTSPGVLVTVTSSGQILVNGVKVSDSELRFAMKSVLDKTPEKTVVLEGDRQAMLGTVVRIMDEGKKAGALKFAIATKGEKN